jgi:hypothetical protein
MALTGAQLVAAIKKHPLASVAILVSFGCAVALYLRADARPAVVSELEQRAAEGERIEENIRNSAQLAEQRAALQEASTAIDARLIRASNLADNLQLFYRIESETGAKITELKQTGVVPPPPKGPKPTYSPIGFTVGLRGSYPQVLDFLRRLETGAPFARIIAANLSNPPESLDKSAFVSLTINVELLGTP